MGAVQEQTLGVFGQFGAWKVPHDLISRHSRIDRIVEIIRVAHDIECPEPYRVALALLGQLEEIPGAAPGFFHGNACIIGIAHERREEYVHLTTRFIQGRCIEGIAFRRTHEILAGEQQNLHRAGGRKGEVCPVRRNGPKLLQQERHRLQALTALDKPHGLLPRCREGFGRIRSRPGPVSRNHYAAQNYTNNPIQQAFHRGTSPWLC